MKKVASLELAITAGTGGKGTVWIDDLTFTELPPAHPYDRTPAAISGSDWTGLDFLESREYGGLVIDWEPGSDAGRYAVEISDDGEAWTPLRTVEGGNGGRDYHYLPETESRYLRLRGAIQRNAKIDVKPLDWAPTINDLFKVMAKDAPRGFYPRAFFGEQPYWTVVGVDGDPEEGLLERGRCPGGREGRVFDRALPLGRRRVGVLGKRSDVPDLGGGIPPDPYRHVDAGRSFFGHHRPRFPIRSMGALSRPQPWSRRQTPAPHPRCAPVPGEPTHPVPQRFRRRLLHPGNRLGRPRRHGQRQADCDPGDRSDSLWRYDLRRRRDL